MADPPAQRQAIGSTCNVCGRLWDKVNPEGATCNRCDNFLPRSGLSSPSRNGANLTSNYKGPPLEVKFPREINAADLVARWSSHERGSPPSLPFLDRPGYVVRGWSHLIASYPKVGKTELVTALVESWQDETVLYFTEEPDSVWQHRLADRGENFRHLQLCPALGADPSMILERIEAGSESVIVIDTIRNLLGIRDESDNAEVARVLNPYIAAAREQDATIIFNHHDRKGGGERGEAISGAHAFFGVVDVALEIRPDPQSHRRRAVRGWARIIDIQELIYERSEDGTFTALGDPRELELDAVKAKAVAALTVEWQTTRQIRDALADPKPSDEQLRQALTAVAQEGLAIRDPSIDAGEQQGKTYKWRRPT